jgi:hypothetical protein
MGNKCSQLGIEERSMILAQLDGLQAGADGSIYWPVCGHVEPKVEEEGWPGPRLSQSVSVVVIGISR